MEVHGQVRRPSVSIDDGPLCQLCIEGGDGIAAETYCRVCKEFLCSTCSNVHRRSKASRSHELIDKDDVGTESPEQYQGNQSEYCEKHPGELIKYYCDNHKSMHCGDCVALDKHRCEMMKISEIAKGFKSSDQYLSFKTSIHALISETSKYKDDIDEMSNSINDSLKESNKQVLEYKDKIIAQLNLRAHELTTQMEAKARDSQTALSNLKDKLVATEAEAQTVIDDSQDNEDNDVLLFIATQRLRGKDQSITDTLKQVAEEREKVEAVEFVKNIDTETSIACTGFLGACRFSHSEVQGGSPSYSYEREDEFIVNRLGSNKSIIITHLKSRTKKSMICLGRFSLSGNYMQIDGNEYVLGYVNNTIVVQKLNRR